MFLYVCTIWILLSVLLYRIFASYNYIYIKKILILSNAYSLACLPLRTLPWSAVEVTLTLENELGSFPFIPSPKTVCIK